MTDYDLTAAKKYGGAYQDCLDAAAGARDRVQAEWLRAARAGVSRYAFAQVTGLHDATLKKWADTAGIPTGRASRR